MAGIFVLEKRLMPFFLINEQKFTAMQKQKTIYHLIVDKSGSMSDCIEQTISGFNEQVSKIREIEQSFPDQEVVIGLTTFNHQVYHHFFQSPTAAVKKLTTATYQPNGTTALLDAIGKTASTIEKEIQEEKDRLNTTVVIVILTDGHENASEVYKHSDIKTMISRLEETGKWTFTFMGATLDAIDVAAAMSIKSQNSMCFSKDNMQAETYDTLSKSMFSYLEKKRKGENLDDFLSK